MKCSARAILSLCLLAGCSGRTALPPSAMPVSTANASAVRLPASASGARRTTDSLDASPDPLGAVAWPLGAVAWPLGAVPWPLDGLPLPTTPAVATQTVCIDENGGGKCKAEINLVAGFNPVANAPASAIPGVQPGLLRYAYDLPSSGGANVVVAVIEAGDDPNAEADLGVYRGAFGLPACTSSNGCFQKIAQSGSGLPPPDPNWSIETSLDLDAVSAVCAQCRLMLVEANSSQIPDLAAAVDTAVAAGAKIVSNSYGVAEASDNVQYASHFEHPGVPITAPAGDAGYGVQFPASVPSVTAVGGTSIEQYSQNGLQEVAWSRTGSGCSAFFAKPAWQSDTLCPGRTTNDVAMASDPADGISVYDSTLPGSTSGGWLAIGGTSMAAPLVAGLFALASSGGSMGSNQGIYAVAASQKSNKPDLLDITSGSDGSCSPAGLCTAGAGFDGPTGNGVPWGVDAFAPQK